MRRLLLILPAMPRKEMYEHHILKWRSMRDKYRKATDIADSQIPGLILRYSFLDTSTCQYFATTRNWNYRHSGTLYIFSYFLNGTLHGICLFGKFICRKKNKFLIAGSVNNADTNYSCVFPNIDTLVLNPDAGRVSVSQDDVIFEPNCLRSRASLSLTS